jgi:microcin C transport system substrate-binding protein
VFENSPMKAEGAPSAGELALLEPFRAKLSPAVFGDAVVPPVSDASGTDRKLLLQAVKLLDDAGYVIKGSTRVTPTGEPFIIEFLIVEDGFERIIQPYIKSLGLLGIQASIRRIDPAQYEQRLKTYDYDLAIQRFVLRLTPGVELASFFSSEQALIDGSFNLAGIREPVVDALLAKIVEAKTRDDLNAASRALDRVLRAGHYWVPHWYKASHTLAYWNRFGQPQMKSPYNDGIVQTWWHDAAKDAKLRSP